MIKTKRVYEPYSPQDGQRILIDRLWPRGLSKENAKIDLWLKDISPSTELRAWFNHDPKKWSEFQKRYISELDNNKEATKVLRTQLKSGPVTLVYAAKDEQHNNAVVLAEYFKK